LKRQVHLPEGSLGDGPFGGTARAERLYLSHFAALFAGATMADSKKKRGRRTDRNRINVDQAYELQYWKDVFDVSAQQIAEAVRHVGPRVKNVAAYLESKTGMKSRTERIPPSARAQRKVKRRRKAA
jgi:hypothetical protein